MPGYIAVSLIRNNTCLIVLVGLCHWCLVLVTTLMQRICLPSCLFSIVFSEGKVENNQKEKAGDFC